MAVLLTQEEATELLELLKKCVSSSISLPKQGGREDISVVSTERESEKFIISVNRRNKRVNKVSYVARYKKGDVVLLRLDVGVTSPHVNPEVLGGEILTGPHLHIYREGFEERYVCLLANSPCPSPSRSATLCFYRLCTRVLNQLVTDELFA